MGATERTLWETYFPPFEAAVRAVRAVRAGDSVAVSVDVTNAGRRAGDEVVQLYLRDDVASVARLSVW